MTWAPLLLADPSPSLRILVLTELIGRKKSDNEVKELLPLRDRDPILKDLYKMCSNAVLYSWKMEQRQFLFSRSKLFICMTLSQKLLRKRLREIRR